MSAFPPSWMGRLSENGGRPDISMPKTFYKYRAFNKEHLRKLVEAGWNDDQVCDFFDINRTTFWRWKKKYKNLESQVDAWKKHADARIERSCYESATGYYKPEEKVFLDKTHVIERKPDGTVLEYDKREVIRVQTMRWYEQNPTAIIFWLTNRQHRDWKRTRQETGSDPLSIKIMQMVNGNGKKADPGGNGKPDVSSAVTIERGMQIVK